jgi:DNA polymerase-3 subunit beta
VKFRVDRDAFADAVAWAARSLPVRPSAPVLSGLLIDASDEGLVLSTFDYETSARATLTAEVADEGRALVSGRLLADICRSLPAKPVDLALDGSRVSLTCGSARFSLQTMPVEDYPSLPDMPAASGTVPSDQFAHAVAQAVTAAGRDDMLPVLTGVRLEISGSTIALLATDRFRLSHRELTWNPNSPDASLAALVPAKVLGDTAKSLTAGPRGHHRAVGDGLGRGDHRLRGLRGRRHPADDDPPARRRVPQGPQPVPAEHLTRALVDKLALIESVKRVALVAERNTAVQLAFSDGVLTLDAGSGDEAQASESIEATIEGEDLTTGFNPQFLLDGLTAIDEAVVELSFTQASKPVVISGSIGEDASAGPATLRSATCSCRAACSPEPPTHRRIRMELGLVGLGKMGGNMRTRLRNAGHTVVGLDHDLDISDVKSLAELVEALPSPRSSG